MQTVYNFDNQTEEAEINKKEEKKKKPTTPARSSQIEPENRRENLYKEEEHKETKIKAEDLFKRTQILPTPLEIDNKTYNFYLETKQDLPAEDDDSNLKLEKTLTIPDQQVRIRKYSNDSQLENDPHKQLTRYRKNSGNLRFTFENSPTVVLENNQIETSEMENTIIKENDNTIKMNPVLNNIRKSRVRPLGGKSDHLNNSRNGISKNVEEESSSGASRKSSGQMDLTDLMQPHRRRKSHFSDREGINRLSITIEKEATPNQEGTKEEKINFQDFKLYNNNGFLSPGIYSKESKELTSPGSDSETSLYAQYNYRTLNSNGKIWITPDNSEIQSPSPESFKSNRRFNSWRQLPVRRSIASTIKEVQMDHEPQLDLDLENGKDKEFITPFDHINLPQSRELNESGNETMIIKSSPMNAELNKERFASKKGRPFRSMKQMREPNPIKVIYEHREEDLSKEKSTTKLPRIEDENPVFIIKKSITDEKANSSDSGFVEGLEVLRFYPDEKNTKDTEDEEDKNKGNNNDLFINTNGWISQSWVNRKQGEEKSGLEKGYDEIECNYNESQDVIRL